MKKLKVNYLLLLITFCELNRNAFKVSMCMYYSRNSEIGCQNENQHMSVRGMSGKFVAQVIKNHSLSSQLHLLLFKIFTIKNILVHPLKPIIEALHPV